MTDPYHPDDELRDADIVVEEEQVVVEPSARAILVRLVWLLIGVIEALIGLRVFLKLIAANPASPFAGLVYGLSDFFLWPFAGLTATPSANGMVLEISSIIAMFVYALIGWVITELLWLLLIPAGQRVRLRERRRRR